MSQSDQTIHYDASSMGYTAIPLNIPELTNSIGLRNNLISSIPSGTLSKFHRCSSVDLSGNKISSLVSTSFDGLFIIKELFLQDNIIGNLPLNVFNIFTQCTMLRLDKNRISNISPGNWNGLYRLKTLSLRENQLTSLTMGGFSPLVACTDLDLGKNMLSNIAKGSFLGMNSLRTLDMAENQISNLPSGLFDGLYFLNTLDLSRNRLSTLSWSAICLDCPLHHSIATQRFHLSLYGNGFDCDNTDNCWIEETLYKKDIVNGWLWLVGGEYNDCVGASSLQLSPKCQQQGIFFYS